MCSRSCGPGGLSRRAVLCLRSVGLDEQSALEPSAETPCNHHVPCPATWAVGNWSQVSVGDGGEDCLQLHHRPLATGRLIACLHGVLTTLGGRGPGAFLWGILLSPKALGIRMPLASRGHCIVIETPHCGFPCSAR
jgi:hypothetical protein